MSFDAFGLDPLILKAVAEEGYTEPTPIQAQAIPVVLQGGDVMGAAQTGTGKTAGFTLPILQLLAPHQNVSPSPARHPVRALILLPTRELALQVAESVATYGRHMQIRSTCVFGGVDIGPQLKIVRAGVEILIATPGRLLDHVEHKSVNLGQVQILVLDEADRMLDMGFMPDIKRIIGLLPAQRQNLLFSATFSDEIKRLAGGILRNPKVIEVARRNATADKVRQVAYAVAADEKRALLKHLVETRDIRQAIVFCNTKLGTARLARHLEREGLKAEAIHGDKSQLERIAALDKFKAGEAHLLVATDVAARGLDIQEMPCVINYELPHSPEDYVHRIGRTGRAGAEGDAISFFSADEERYLIDIEKLIKVKIERAAARGFEPVADEPHFHAGRRERSRGRFDRESPSRHTRNVKTEKVDPWFLKPYEEGTAPTSAPPAKANEPAPPATPARKAGVGALLGGLAKKP
ncbi:MAG: DEAD/DEAH box helicase [Burkholderiales bacterium]|nr:DEAD/DEAH box helicase [Burkholderiales bacterium]